MAYLAKCDKYNIATNILLRGGGIDQAWLDHKGRLMGTCLKPTPIGQFMVMLMKMMMMMICLKPTPIAIGQFMVMLMMMMTICLKPTPIGQFMLPNDD